MSELQNPLFDDEKEFLERKKLEYERALRGDVDHIKEQSVVVGKIALVGAGLAGGIWLISKAFGSKKRKKKRAEPADDHEGEYYTAANGKRYNSAEPRKSAAASAQIFEDYHDNQHESDDLGFGSVDHNKAHAEPVDSSANAKASAFAEPNFEADPFEDLPYDDSRRLPASHDFGDEAHQEKMQATAARNSRTRMIGSVLQSFLQSDTGKVLVAQAGAVALALVTKKLGEFFPATKNSDLAASPGSAAAANGDSPVASPAPSVSSSDASNPPQSL